TELEKILEVHQPQRFELPDYLGERLLARYWTDGDQRALDPEFVRCQSETFVECPAIETALLVRRAANEQRRRSARYRDRHERSDSYVELSIAFSNAFIDLRE